MFSMRNCFWASALVLVFAGCESEAGTSALPYFTAEDRTPVWTPAPRDLDLMNVGTFSFTDQAGIQVTDASMDGRIFVASFFFVDCKDICPTLRTRLTGVQEAFTPDDVAILSHSVTPDTDSVEKLAAYSAVNHIDGRQWHLLTGEKADIYRMATERYGVQLTRQTGSESIDTDFLHTETFFLVDGLGYVRGLYNGTLALEVERLLEDARALLDEGSRA